MECFFLLFFFKPNVRFFSPFGSCQPLFLGIELYYRGKLFFFFNVCLHILIIDFKDTMNICDSQQNTMQWIKFPKKKIK